ncbi:MAG: hypothetical protein KIT84_16360 [Labilithrix sp.]|nr:hypothetical protein [Labilithrix sp.]MCW5812603.1 hypothetical protein [Labilithrix sp.]
MIRSVLAYALVVYLALLVAVRPWQRDWGSTAEERSERLPGDERSATPERAGDRAIAIDAPASVVWSWLVQIGQDRGAPLGGLFADRLGWEVDHVEEGRLLALRHSVFEVEPTSERTSRLHVRTHAGDVPVPLAPVLFMAFEPAHFVMERAMLRGIKERAEKGPDRTFAWVERTTVKAGDDVVVRFGRPVDGVAIDQRWVTLAPAGVPVTSTSGRVVLDRGMQDVRLRAGHAGPYEVRIYGRYPEKESHLLMRIPVDVEGYLVRTGSEPLSSPREQ